MPKKSIVLFGQRNLNASRSEATSRQHAGQHREQTPQRRAVSASPASGCLGCYQATVGAATDHPEPTAKLGLQGSRQVNKIRLHPRQAAVPHMECTQGEWRKTRPNRHPELVVDATLCPKGYRKAGRNTLNSLATIWGATLMIAMPDTEAMTCILGKSVTKM